MVTCFSAPCFPVFVLAFIQVSAQMLHVLLLAYGLFQVGIASVDLYCLEI